MLNIVNCKINFGKIDVLWVNSTAAKEREKNKQTDNCGD
jgi:hypothetical protein